MKAQEFKDWSDLLATVSDEAERELVWGLMRHFGENVEYFEEFGKVRVAEFQANAIYWAAFWPSVAAVICMAIYKWSVVV